MIPTAIVFSIVASAPLKERMCKLNFYFFITYITVELFLCLVSNEGFVEIQKDYGGI